MKFTLIAVCILGLFLVLVPNVVFLLVKIISLIAGFHIKYKAFALTAAGLLAAWVLLFIYGNQIGRFRHQIRELEYSHADIPEAFDGYRIVQISDIHLDGWAGHEKQLQKRVDEVNAIAPDAIFFTGDLVSLSPKELEPFIPILTKLNAKDGVFSVLGNHDYFPYMRYSDAEQRWKDVDELSRMEKEELGWKLLRNENSLISRGADTIAVLGCENQSVGVHDVVHRGDLKKTMDGCEGKFRILLTHDPSQWRKEVLPLSDIPLTLSGHTHAMQFRIFGFTPSKWLYPECDGLYSEDGRSLYVNIGLGGTMPMRIGARPEITIITLKKK